MKLTSHQLAATIIVSFMLTILGLPFIGVIRGTQPMFYASGPNPNDYDDYSSYLKTWRTPLKTYRWDEKTATVIGDIDNPEGSYERFQKDVAAYELKNGYKYPTKAQKFDGIIRIIELILLGVALVGKSAYWSLVSLNKPDVVLFNIKLPKRRKKDFV